MTTQNPTEQVWTEAPKELRSTPQQRKRRWADLFEALKSNKTIFVPETYAVRAQAAMRIQVSTDDPSKMLRIRTVTHDGQKGIIMWIDKRDS